MTRRKLTDEEIALWKKVTDTAVQLHPERVSGHKPKPTPKKGKPSAAQPQSPTPTRPTQPPRVAMDAKAYSRLKRGKLKPEARLDLHGMTLGRAHGVLTNFVLASQASGHRLVLVITGKGRTSDHEPFGMTPYPRGVLNRQVPQWLAMAPLSQAVLQVQPAHIRHGGEGAYYVYLKRSADRALRI